MDFEAISKMDPSAQDKILKDFVGKIYSKQLEDLERQAEEKVRLIVQDELSKKKKLKIRTSRTGEGVSSMVPLPKQGSSKAHAFDIYTPVAVTVPARGKVAVPVGRKFDLPDNHAMVLWSRSGLSAKHNLEKGAGLIDEDYGDELIVILYNLGDQDFNFNANERICQAFLMESFEVVFEEVDDITLSDDRGGGLGSSGLK